MGSSVTDPTTPAASTEPPPRRGVVRRALPLLGALVVLLAVAYGAVAVWAGTRAAAGTTVAGVAVGGMDRTDIERALSRELDPRAERPLPLRLGQGTSTVVPSEAGLRSTPGRPRPGWSGSRSHPRGSGRT